jgi:hypothetical protein
MCGRQGGGGQSVENSHEGRDWSGEDYPGAGEVESDGDGDERAGAKDRPEPCDHRSAEA